MLQASKAVLDMLKASSTVFIDPASAQGCFIDEKEITGPEKKMFRASGTVLCMIHAFKALYYRSRKVM